jgi:hypothetical protein
MGALVKGETESWGKKREAVNGMNPEMEFLDISLTNRCSMPHLHAVPSTCGFKKNHTSSFSGFKDPYNKIFETRKLKSVHE